MALAREVDSLDTVPEYARAGYKQVGEKWVNEDVEDVSALKGALKKEREGRELTAKELAAYKAAGATPEEIAELKRKGAPAGPDAEHLETLVNKRLAPVLLERDALAAENRTLKLTDKVRADFLDAGGRKVDADLALLETNGRFTLSDKGKVVVLDDDGDPSGVSPKEWFATQYKERRPNLFEGTNASGGGAQHGGSGGSGDADIRKLPGARMVEHAFGSPTK